MSNPTSFPHEPFDAVPPANPQIYNPLKDGPYVTGLVFLAISIAGLLLSAPHGVDIFSSMFLLHYMLAIVYSVFLAVDKRARWWLFGARPADYPTMLLSLLLWMVSCFSLNHAVTIFKPSADWLNIHLVISGAACIAYAWQDRMSAGLRGVLYFVLAATAILFAYYAVCTLPLFAMGLMLFWFFGLPIHGLIAVIFTVYLVLILGNALLTGSPRQRLPIVAGLALPIVAVVWFASSWFILNSQVISALRIVKTQKDATLPRWVAVSQRLKNTPATGKMLEAVANGTMRSGNTGPFDMLFLPSNNADKNDPLMQVASAVSPVPDLSRDECASIYTSLYDARHTQEERLWAGNNLETKTVETKVMLDPGHRLSYTEKTLTVGYKVLNQESGPRTQEAIYTFFLPEGGVVTALSLWINGQEEPALLTSKSKAKTAYTSIVGVERRDPAVVHWQEGNMVQVRVFPVAPDLPRRFKIGITAPLRLDKENLDYQNVSFDGPPALLATERDSLFFLKNGTFTSSPTFFQQNTATVTYSGIYRHTWSAACQTAPLSRTIFSFDGNNYSVEPYTPQMENFRPEKIYLDLNWAWTTADWKAVRPLLRNATVYVPVDGGFERLTDENATSLFRQAKQLRFSLFPFPRIGEPEKALVIAKSAHPTPRPADLGDALFRRDLKAMAGQAPIRVFHLGSDEPSAYLQSLVEARSIRCQQGDLASLEKVINRGIFLQNMENEHTVLLPSAGLLIKEQNTDTTATKAPDHLFRLFAYQSILRDLGLQENEPENLIRLAEQAYIVTPVSSLVTLETQADYDRFQIQPTEALNTLGNASFSNAGSVPEPHEWALILLLAVAVLVTITPLRGFGR